MKTWYKYQSILADITDHLEDLSNDGVDPEDIKIVVIQNTIYIYYYSTNKII